MNRTPRDVFASGKTGLPPGVRQSETLRDGRFCTNFSAMVLGHSANYAHRTITWSCHKIAPSEWLGISRTCSRHSATENMFGFVVAFAMQRT